MIIITELHFFNSVFHLLTCFLEGPGLPSDRVKAPTPIISTQIMTEIPSSFLSMIGNASPNVLKEMKRLISDKLSSSPKVNDYVTFKNSLENVDEDLQNRLLDEAESLKINTNSPGVNTQWLNSCPGSYVYSNTTHAAKNLNDYSAIGELMSIINSLPESTHDMDSCLVSCYSTDKTSLSYHADDEDGQISQSSSICSYSIGTTMTFDVIKKTAKVTRRSTESDPLLSLELSNGSLTMMHPGCQQTFLHRVCASSSSEKSQVHLRYSFSFRKYVAPECSPGLTPFKHTTKAIPLIQESTPTCLPSAPVSESSKVEPTLNNEHNEPIKSKPKAIILLAGDSFLKDLDPSKLGKGKKPVVNISKGGSKIRQVEDSLKQFATNGPPVHKLFLSIGANDIRYVKNGVQHLKTPITNLLKIAKSLFPGASIFIQSMLPLPLQKPTTICNILDLNYMIFNICTRLKVFYMDILESFLDPWTGLRNTIYFPEANNIHLGKIGTSVLAKIYLRHIHSRRFNPLGY